MKRPVTHNPAITFDQAACSCRAWPGPARREGEAIGVYTLRAAAAHQEHAIGTQEAPPDLFSAAPSEPEPFGLFAAPAATINSRIQIVSIETQERF